MSGVKTVADYGICALQTTFDVDVVQGWKFNAYDSRRGFNHTIEEASIIGGRTTVPDRDRERQDALYHSMVELGHDPSANPEAPNVTQKVQPPLGFCDTVIDVS